MNASIVLNAWALARVMLSFTAPISVSADMLQYGNHLHSKRPAGTKANGAQSCTILRSQGD